MTRSPRCINEKGGATMLRPFLFVSNYRDKNILHSERVTVERMLTQWEHRPGLRIAWT